MYLRLTSCGYLCISDCGPPLCWSVPKYMLSQRETTSPHIRWQNSPPAQGLCQPHPQKPFLSFSLLCLWRESVCIHIHIVRYCHWLSVVCCWSWFIPKLVVRSYNKKLRFLCYWCFAVNVSSLPCLLFLSAKDQGYICKNNNDGGTLASHGLRLFITAFIWKWRG